MANQERVKRPGGKSARAFQFSEIRDYLMGRYRIDAQPLMDHLLETRCGGPDGWHAFDVVAALQGSSDQVAAIAGIFHKDFKETLVLLRVST